MDCKFNMQDLIPFAALVKLSASKDIADMSDRDFLIELSNLVWDYELLYQEIFEHEGFKWCGEKQSNPE